MGKLFTLTDDVRLIAQNAIDDLIDQLGKDCRLIYPPDWQQCANCIYDSIGEKSSNIWITGGPIPFDAGSTCPMCGGVGRRAIEKTANIRMLVQAEPSKWWVKPPFNVQVPTGMIQTKGYMSDVPRLLQSRKMIFQTDIEGIMRMRYELVGEPIDQGNIIQGRYFVALWQRVPG
jgi:hypothetical protein